MSDNIIGRIIIPKEAYGSDKYTVILEITNLTNNVIIINSIQPELIPGKILSIEESASITEINELVDLKRKLVREMEEQVSQAYGIIYKRKPSPAEVILSPLNAYIDLVVRVMLLTSGNNKEVTYYDEAKPSWASQALTIHEWDDVENLDRELIQQLEESSFLRKAFYLNKEKLRNCMEKISSTESPTNEELSLDTGIVIPSKETVAFPYRCVAPYRFSSSDFDIHFNVSYKSQNLDIQGNYPIRDSLKINASSSSITFGAIVGALLGFAVKSTIVDSFEWFDKPFWASLIGSITLAIILAVATSKNSTSKKIITIENYAGGLLIGALCALFSSKIIVYLEKLIPQ